LLIRNQRDYVGVCTPEGFLDACEHPLLGETIGSRILHLLLVEYFQSCKGVICARSWLTPSFLLFLLIRLRHLLILMVFLLFKAIIHLRVFLLFYGGCGVCTEVTHYALPHGRPPAGPSSLLVLLLLLVSKHLLTKSFIKVMASSRRIVVCWGGPGMLY
jgi:hypothetical protein